MGKLKISNTGFAIALFIFGVAVSAYQNRGGSAIPTGDSGSNLISALSMVETGEHAWPTYELGAEGTLKIVSLEKNTVWPPMSASIVAALIKLGFSEHMSVFIFTVFFAGLTLMLAFVFSLNVTNSFKASLLITLLFFSLWNFQYWISRSYMPEGLYISITLLIGVYLMEIIRNHRYSFTNLLLLGILTSSTYYIKSAAPAFILAVLTSLFIYFLRQGLIKSVKLSSSVALGVLIGATPWVIRNLYIGTIGGSGAAGESPLFQSVLSLLRLIVPHHGAYFSSKISLVILGLVLVLIMLIGYLLIRGFNLKKQHNFISQTTSSMEILFPLIYLLIFIVIIFFAIYIVPKASHIEERYWMEIFPFIVPIVYLVAKKLFLQKSKNMQQLISILTVSMLITVMVYNMYETKRNFNKKWTILSSEEEKKEFREKLCSLVPGKTIKYSSNFGNELFAKSGLSYWNTNTETDALDVVNIYLDFNKDITIDLLNLGTIKTDSTSKEYLGEIDNFKVYRLD